MYHETNYKRVLIGHKSMELENPLVNPKHHKSDDAEQRY